MGTLLQNQLVADEFQLSTCYRLFKLCYPPAKLIITNIALVDFINYFFFFNPENFIMSFFTVLDGISFLFINEKNK